MIQQFFMIMPMKDKALKYIDKFGSERLKIRLCKAMKQYKSFKHYKIPDIGVAQITCYSGPELLKLARAKETEDLEND